MIALKFASSLQSTLDQAKLLEANQVVSDLRLQMQELEEKVRWKGKNYVSASWIDRKIFAEKKV